MKTYTVSACFRVEWIDDDPHNERGIISRRYGGIEGKVKADNRSEAIKLIKARVSRAYFPCWSIRYSRLDVTLARGIGGRQRTQSRKPHTLPRATRKARQYLADHPEEEDK